MMNTARVCHKPSVLFSSDLTCRVCPALLSPPSFFINLLSGHHLPPQEPGDQASNKRMSDPSESQLIITEFIDAVRPQYVLVVAVAPFCGCLLTLLAILFAFSTPASRSLLVFKLNVVAILAALVTGILNGYINALGLLEPFASDATLSICFTFAFFTLCPPLFYDSILLLRVLTLYPIRSTPLLTLAKVLAIPILVKCGRLVCLSLFLHGYYVNYVTNGPATDWFRNPPPSRL
ncbi:hypothetical protein EDD16DRAFT_1250124 [Pisolithus croceorrhizus]|nr:hypothetical protein EDD16DRAFT_1250124 [Pisolithus croceorrhizus]